MKGIGLKIKHMAEELIDILMAVNTKVIGKKINKMEMDLKVGLMVRCMKGSMCWVKNMEEGNSLGQMNLLTRESSLTTTFMEEGFMSGPMEGGSRVIGRIIRWKGKVFSLGLTVEGMKGIIMMTKNRGKGHLSGPMAEDMWDCGIMESNMGLANILLLMEAAEMENGNKARELDGLMKND